MSDPELVKKVARHLQNQPARVTLIDYWWATEGWVKPDWEAIADAAIAAVDLERGNL